MSERTGPATAFQSEPQSWGRAIRARARPPGPFEGVNLGERDVWRVDYAVLGALTGVCAPGAVTVVSSMIEAWVILQVIASGVVGAMLGTLVGATLHSALRGFLARHSVAAFALFAMVVGAAWGAGASWFGALAAPVDDWIVVGGWRLLSATCGAVAGAAQCAWFAPLYACRRASGRSTGWLPLVAGMVSLTLGWAALYALDYGEHAVRIILRWV